MSLILIALLPTAFLQPAAPNRLVVHPASVALASARAGAQLVVTGVLPDGREVDLTGVASFKPESTLVEVSGGYIRARADGATGVRVDVAGLSARVPVAVSGFTRPDPVGFRAEVQAALTKQGCNGGSCHGSPQGKGGFSLSLFGYDPAVDEENLVRGGLNRRIDLADPHGSLLLKKPLMRLAHVGGKKLAPADAAYEVLRRWIAEGAQTADKGAPECNGIRVHPSGARVLKAPWLGQQVSVVATFADGSTRDVTAIATYETSHKDVVSVDPRGRASGLKAGQAAVSVRYLSHLESVHFTVVEDVPGFRWPDPPAANFVDELVHRKLRQLQVPPSGLCDDGAFLRRIHLDLTGLLPSAEAVRAFLRDTTPGKRMRVIDSLLASEEFARYWGQRAADLMRVNAKGLPGGRAEIFAGFITDSLRRNMPFDKFATAILTATGDGAEVPEANYFLAIDKLSDLTETTAQLFMGSRINCAKCHNHPFENWTQDDYYRISAVFARVRNENGAVGLSESGETRHPVNGRVMPPFAAPKAGLPVAPDRRADFARWLTAPGNPYFARVEANRAWAALFGRGIVDPVDDFRSSNPPSNPDLLDGLAAFLERSGYDRRALIRAICASNTYQASAVPLPLNRHDDSLFSHARVRRLSAEQLQDAVGLATGQLRPPAEIGSDIAGIEARLASRAAELAAGLAEWKEAMSAKVSNLPWWAGAWKVSGPFSKHKEDPHTVSFRPEGANEPDAAGKPDPVRWKVRDDLTGNQPFMLGPAEGATYMACAVFSRPGETSIAKIDAGKADLKAWVDGKLVFDSRAGGKKNGVGKRDVPLKLSPGTHQVLFKFSKKSGPAQVRLSVVPADGKAPAIAGLTPAGIEMLAAGDGSGSSTFLADMRAAGDPVSIRLRSQLKNMAERSGYATQRFLPEQTQFLKAFGQPPRESPCACERSDEPTVDQALQMLNGPVVAKLVSAAPDRYGKLPDAGLAEEMYLSTLSRMPTETEKGRVAAYLARQTDRAEAVRDLVWALVNTREFLLQH